MIWKGVCYWGAPAKPSQSGVEGAGRMTLPRLFCYSQIALRRGIMSLGIDLYLRTDDRRVLEQIILPYFAERSEFSRVLFVGCDWYTRGYARIFRAKTYITLEIEP